MVITIHVNPSQIHQLEHAQWFRDGFKRHGLTFDFTNSVTKKSNIHIISGPHYAKSYWQKEKHPRVLYLDSAYYHDEHSGKWHSTDYISLGWMNQYGGRDFISGKGKRIPEKAINKGRGTIFLADYNGPIEQADTIRFHPAQQKSDIPLIDDLKRHKKAIGYSTKALVRAALLGLDVIAKDEQHILNQPNWIELLPYADWHYSDIQSGAFWEHLCQQL